MVARVGSGSPRRWRFFRSAIRLRRLLGGWARRRCGARGPRGGRRGLGAGSAIAGGRLRVGEGQIEALAGGGGEGHLVPGGVDLFDGCSGAVEQSELVVVAQCEDLVAAGKRAAGEDDFVVAEVALIPERVAGPAVEVIDVGEAGGDHQNVLTSDAGVHPLV